MYAVIQTGGKQYRVAEGDVIQVDRLGGNPGDSVEFSQVLLLEENGNYVSNRMTSRKLKYRERFSSILREKRYEFSVIRDEKTP